MAFFHVSCYFLPLRLHYIPQHSKPTFFPYVTDQVSHSHEKRKDYMIDSVYLNFVFLHSLLTIISARNADTQEIKCQGFKSEGFEVL